jgi:hypothetical protein
LLRKGKITISIFSVCNKEVTSPTLDPTINVGKLQLFLFPM